MAARIVRLLAEREIPVTVLGKEPLPGAAFLPDDDSVTSPLDALRRFTPTHPLVFTLSCDIPRFDARLVEALQTRIGETEAAVPFVDGFRQPLVALYRAEAFSKLPPEGCPMDWLNLLDVQRVSEEDLLAAGVHPDATRGANTREELAALLGDGA